jgi:hypothetical protein
MKTECTAEQLEFHGLGRRVVVGEFDGGRISSDSGGLLLREVEQRSHILKRLAGCFSDYRDAELIEHSLEALIKQRVIGLALGYEDLNDHDRLRQDPLLAVLSDVADPMGQDRRREQDKGCSLAGKSTLNRLELTPLDADSSSRYKKIVANPAAMDALLVDLFLEAHDKPPEQIILDVDATDDPLHGHQEGRFFHGYYRSYCYLPLYIFCGEQLLCARLRTADQDGAAGTVDELAGIVARIRLSWPQTRINVTKQPTAQRTAQQMVEAFPWNPAPRYLLRDRDKIFSTSFRHRIHTLSMREVLIAPRSPWQNPYVERLIGSIHGECLDHVIVFNERHLKKLLRAYLSYYHTARTHLALDKQCPEPRSVELPDQGTVIAFPHVGGLHHEYRRAA